MAKIILNPNETNLYKAIYAAYCKEVGIERGPTDLIPEDDRDWVHYDEQGNLVWEVEEKLFEFMANNLIVNMPFYVSFWKKITAINELIRSFVKTHLSTYMSEFIEKFGAIEREFSKYAFERKLKLKTTDELLALQKEAQDNLEEVTSIRSIGDPVRGGRIKHLGKMPYYKTHLQSIDLIIASRVNFNAGDGMTKEEKLESWSSIPAKSE